MITRSNIRYWWIALSIFSGMVLLFSCNKPEQYLGLSGGGNASAKFGDSNITFKDTILNIGGYTFSNYAPVSSSSFSLYIRVGLNSDFVGSYLLGGNTGLNGQVSGILAATQGYFYTTDATHTGMFTVNSYNPQLQIISGTFHFTAVLYDTAGQPVKNDTIVVRNGNFVSHIFTDYNLIQ